MSAAWAEDARCPPPMGGRQREPERAGRAHGGSARAQPPPAPTMHRAEAAAAESRAAEETGGFGDQASEEAKRTRKLRERGG